ncbi:MAG: T9SS type A sorting domain-containing protein, partial [Gloeobacteraceae cyanobacterium ES-bin-316]|nr:T9SS type A sorting domain-containing protein [Ferruginibacter sp.]
CAETTGKNKNEDISNFGQPDIDKGFKTLLDAPEVLMKTSPNPFVETTTIQYQLKATAQISISVFDAQGKEVRMLTNKLQKAGSYTENFNGKDLTPGIYFIKISKDGFVKQTLKIVKG